MFSHQIPRLLLLSCSQRKRQDATLLPALERYDGPTFQVLRRYQRVLPEHRVDTYVLSAKYGLIPGHREIPAYDEVLTAERAEALRADVARTMGKIVDESKYQAIFACAGQDYLDLMVGGLLESRCEIASGTVGRQLTLLHQWLYGHPNTPAPAPVGDEEVVSVAVRGIEVTMTPAEARLVLQEALQTGEGKPSSFQSWYAEVDGRPVSIKWAVSQLTGLGVSDFHTDDAKRVLQQFGFTINLKK